MGPAPWMATLPFLPREGRHSPQFLCNWIFWDLLRPQCSLTGVTEDTGVHCPCLLLQGCLMWSQVALSLPAPT